ncbi:matrixin family metalloprotease [Bacillus sp. FJAT-49705]|uniref:Matrixin family metalloprotease n=1 Tax=Cytobacillus citreus TaxID=2833586 RepID=A0ABS5NNR1_9BACI|nr:matrixin family metalloprotease [Cytobacillus citreus]MBS4189472.1 matrixin family metalloprotease [Cytobacillus citreus]
MKEKMSMEVKTDKSEKKQDLKYVQEYLCRYGYLKEESFKPGILDDETSIALTKYQEFNGLRDTGVFNEETRNHMRQPRCGVPDILPTQLPTRNEVYFSTTCRWKRDVIRFAIFSDDALRSQAVRNAFRTWGKLIPLTFREVSENPDVVISWVREADDPEHALLGESIAHSDFPPGCSILVNELPLPIHFKEEVDWSPNGNIDVETVALHEIGHTLGLKHSDDDTVMAQSYGGIRRTLTLDDIYGIETLYPRILRRGDMNHENDGEFVGEIAMIRRPTPTRLHVITAVKTEGGTLKLISWNFGSDGFVSKIHDSGSLAGVASYIDMAKGERIVTSCRNGSGNLFLISWDVDDAGNITRAGDSGSQAGSASKIKIVALSDTLFVTGCRAGNGDLLLISWKINSDGSLTRKKESRAGTVSEISLIKGFQSNHVITSVRDGNGNLKIIVWNVDGSTGEISQLGHAEAGEAKMIRAVRSSSGNIVTSLRDGNGNLKLIAWTISPDGKKLTRLNDSGYQASEINDNALMSRPNGIVISAVKTEDGILKLIAWKLESNGITRAGSSAEQAGTASLITICQEAFIDYAPIVTAVRDGNDNIKLISWDDLF